MSSGIDFFTSGSKCLFIRSAKSMILAILSDAKYMVKHSIQYFFLILSPFSSKRRDLCTILSGPFSPAAPTPAPGAPDRLAEGAIGIYCKGHPSLLASSPSSRPFWNMDRQKRQGLHREHRQHPGIPRMSFPYTS